MLPEQMRRWMGFVRAAAARYELDPAIVLAIIQVESSGNNAIGDYGHRRGLMQIDNREHKTWLDVHESGMDPESNIDYGCSLVRTGIDYFDGDLRAGIAAYDCGVGSAEAGLRESGDPDKYTTGGHYSTRVLGWVEVFRPDEDEKSDISGLIANYVGIVRTAHEQDSRACQ
jgi:soluble lytic murein transglycosylase-like protein